MKKKSAVKWLAEKYDYVIWMRNRDEISAGIADEWRKHYLQKAIQMHEEEIIAANEDSSKNDFGEFLTGDQYYDKIYGNKSDYHIEQHLEVISAKTEISDDEIEKIAKEYVLYNESKRNWVVEGMKLYREQLKLK